MSCSPSIVNHTIAATAMNGSSSTASRRNARVESPINRGRRRKTNATVEITVTGRRAIACPAIQL